MEYIHNKADGLLVIASVLDSRLMAIIPDLLLLFEARDFLILAIPDL